MEKMFIILCMLLFMVCYKVNCQESFAVDKWREYIEEWAESTENEEQAEALYADLSQLAEHPFDLNMVTREQLQRLPFLTDRQIDALLDYRRRSGGLLTVYELQGIYAMDWQTILLLLPFVRVGEFVVEKRKPSVENLFKYGKNELQLRYDYCFQQKAGYRAYPDSILARYPNRRYLGEPFYTSVRYSYAFEDILQAGILAEKDMGEPFWKPQHKGYDFYSFHFLLRDQGWLKTLALGDYKVSFGQGLVISNDFTPSRSALVAQAERRNNGFRRHFSTNEHDFFRGAALTARFVAWNLSAFYSRRRLDAALEGDTFPSIQTSGLHRLQRDYAKRHQLVMQTVGGNIRFALPWMHVGATAVRYDFGGKDWQPTPRLYNLFYFRGRSNFNIGVDYRLKNAWIKFFGETARSQNGAWATLNALQLTPSSYLSALFLYRYYDRRYQAYFANAFSQSDVQNESGFYLGLQWVPLPYWKLSAYADIFRHPWLRYGVDTPSTGKEYMLQADYSHGERISTYLRYKYKRREMSSTQHRLRAQVSWSANPSLVFRSSADATLYVSSSNEKNRGFMLAQSAGWKPTRFPLGIDLFAAYFHTDNYYTRISSYEKNILYAFSLPSFYGRGIRAAISFRWDITRSLVLSAKLAHTLYFDRDVIGTETEQITGSQKTDLYALLRWKF